MYFSDAEDPKNQMYPPTTQPMPQMPPQYPPTYPINAPPMQGYGTTGYIQQPPTSAGGQQVIVIGGCPACRVSILSYSFNFQVQEQARS